MTQFSGKVRVVDLLEAHIQSNRPFSEKMTPADNLSRQQWQDGIEALVEQLRSITGRAAFGLTDAEISVHYHRPLDEFRRSLESKLGITSRSC